MRRGKTWLSYSPLEGVFTVKREVEGQRQPITARASHYELRGIGDMDVNEMIQIAMDFPNRDHLVVKNGIRYGALNLRAA